MLNGKHIFLFITILGMELCWLYALLNAANKSVSGKLSVPIMLLVLLGSCSISIALRYLRWPKSALTTLSWVIWPAVMLLMVKVQLFPKLSFGDSAWLASVPHSFFMVFSNFEPALLILLGTAVLWWLGRRLAHLKADFSTSLWEFQFGLVMLAIIFFTAYELNLDQSSSVSVAMVFFSLSLSGASISRARDVRWLNSWRNGHWSWMLLASIAIVLLSGLLIGFIFTPGLVQLFLKALSWIWGMIERAFTFFTSLFPAQSPSSPPPLPSIPSGGMEETQGFKAPEWLRPGLVLVWEILAGGLLLFAIWRLASQFFGWMRRQMTATGSEVEHLKGTFKLDFLDFLKWIISRVFGIRFLPLKKCTRYVPPEIASVRQLYGELLQWAAKEGYPRQEAQTPGEFRDRLNRVIRQNREDLSFITGYYESARYGKILPTENELDRLRQKWHDLRKTELKKPGGRLD